MAVHSAPANGLASAALLRRQALAGQSGWVWIPWGGVGLAE